MQFSTIVCEVLVPADLPSFYFKLFHIILAEFIKKMHNKRCTKCVHVRGVRNGRKVDKKVKRVPISTYLVTLLPTLLKVVVVSILDITSKPESVP